jgi:hypothetical protein
VLNLKTDSSSFDDQGPPFSLSAFFFALSPLSSLLSSALGA